MEGHIRPDQANLMNVFTGLFISGDTNLFHQVLSYKDKKLICPFKDCAKAEQCFLPVISVSQFSMYWTSRNFSGNFIIFFLDSAEGPQVSSVPFLFFRKIPVLLRILLKAIT
jgi:hypothetical protein